MKTFLECIPCFLRQTLEAARMVGDDPQLQRDVMRAVLRMAAEMDLERTPPEMARRIHAVIRERSGVEDPYRAIKQRFNRLVLDQLPALRRRLAAAEDPFDAALRLALAGNIIDFGTPGAVTAADLAATVERSMTAPIHGLDSRRLAALVARAGRVLYVGDNAGEIVFDRLLIEQIGCHKVTFVVRAGPIINDVTAEDAREVGLADRVAVIDTGSRAPGALLAEAGADFRRALDAADLVLSKGQGNYETLSGLAQPVVFLLRAKCPVISAHIGVAQDTMVVEGRHLPAAD